MNWQQLSHASLPDIIHWAESQPWFRAMADCAQDAQWHSEGDVWTHTQMVCQQLLKLDEWLGLPMRHPATCESYFREKVLRPLGIARSRYRGFRSQPKDPASLAWNRPAAGHLMGVWRRQRVALPSRRTHGCALGDVDLDAVGSHCCNVRNRGHVLNIDWSSRTRGSVCPYTGRQRVT